MGAWRYRAATPMGAVRTGVLDGESREEIIDQLRRLGLIPIETSAQAGARRPKDAARAGNRARQAAITAIGELAVLLEAGLTLDRALAVSESNIANPAVKAAFARIHAAVKEGVPLSRALGEAKGLYPPMASAMCEAGEADGRLGAALSRLADTLDRAEALRQTVVSSLIYPAVLIVVACGVILTMLLFVVPQFETLFNGAEAKLPVATRVIIEASRLVRGYGLMAALAAIALVFILRQQLKRPGIRLALDRLLLGAPQVGPLIVNAETAAFARTLGSLVDGGVPLPTATAIAQRSVTNTHMAAAIAKVTAGLKEGAGLSGPLAASKVFPPMALSFLRTGEETARLGLMLGRLADVLDRTVRTSLQRLLAILTPAITVAMAGVVATVIASIMTAILGFNDLAVS